MADQHGPGWIVRHLDETVGTPCPCGTSYRALTGRDNDVLSVHRVEIRTDSRLHYHTRLTETYVVLEGTGQVQVDDQRVDIRPGSIVHIRPGTRHRAIGRLVILNIVVPPFDPTDEHED